MRIVRVAAEAGPTMAVLAADGTTRFLPARETSELVRLSLELVGGPQALETLAGEPVEGTRLCPVSDPRKVVAIGLNYVDHAAEVAMTLPAEPLVFAKFPSSIVGPDEPIRWTPDVTQTVDYEAELAVVIGATARDVPVERALEHVFAYTCLNDVSARDLQFGDGQWVRGKSLDTFCPIGPELVTPDEVPDPQALPIRLRIGDEVLQDGTTADMIFGVAELISRLSRAFTLEPGDVIATGTPPGVGFSRDPKRFLRDGETVVVEIDGVGRLANPVAVGSR